MPAAGATQALRLCRGPLFAIAGQSKTVRVKEKNTFRELIYE